MFDFLKLDWRNFMVDLWQDPSITFGRIAFILKNGTSIDRAKKIVKALKSDADFFKTSYPDEYDYLMQQCSGGIDIFPYPKIAKSSQVESGFDEATGLPYVIHGESRLYFTSVTRREDMLRAYHAYVEDEGILGTGLRAKSPHSYVDAQHKVEQGDIVIDVGCSEGLFSLDAAPRAKRLVLFEMLERWNKPLQLTFQPFRDKVKIVNKLVSGETTEKSTRLIDVEMGDGSDTYFIKMDIEGWEGEVLRASQDFLTSHRVKISCCTYHRQEDAEKLSQLLQTMGFKVRYSDGYMIPPLDVVKSPYFRRGMIYARNF